MSCFVPRVYENARVCSCWVAPRNICARNIGVQVITCNDERVRRILGWRVRNASGTLVLAEGKCLVCWHGIAKMQVFLPPGCSRELGDVPVAAGACPAMLSQSDEGSVDTFRGKNSSVIPYVFELHIDVRFKIDYNSKGKCSVGTFRGKKSNAIRCVCELHIDAMFKIAYNS